VREELLDLAQQRYASATRSAAKGRVTDRRVGAAQLGKRNRRRPDSDVLELGAKNVPEFLAARALTARCSVSWRRITVQATKALA
jgi:hypothetical protein